ncbi:ABC transporter permease [Nocardia terpenica]|uniref:Transport permease protein n=1 Tax=Nocardia terpenica TaxID=455432 RepID=A0A0U1Z2B5_9NOCA|nr:ABC transporter permease [Nocardia terpenica]AJO72723.1 ABC-2 type transporter [Nocardia terpenica]KZM75345.1 ABC transporter [Nocardia terpenica]NQE85802.1 ABC transporter permease [Nocardia terpenica]BBE00953.1 ABC-2 type transporter [Nocardia terpenica]
MTTVSPADTAATGLARPLRSAARTGSSLGTFGALLARDLFVMVREVRPFLVQVVLQRLVMVFVFGVVLGKLGLATPAMVKILLPGVVSMTIFGAAVQNTALPMAIDFAAGREIEDRLLAPISVTAVAIEKVVFGAMRGLIGGIIITPVGLAMLGGHWPLSALPAVVGISVLGALAGAAMGLVIGTSVAARHINVVFAAVLLPMTFTGGVQFPFFGLEKLRWFQVVAAANPMTYLSEGIRWLVMPDMHSIALWIDAAVLLGATAVLLAIGCAGFRRRAQD